MERIYNLQWPKSSICIFLLAYSCQTPNMGVTLFNIIIFIRGLICRETSAGKHSNISNGLQREKLGADLIRSKIPSSPKPDLLLNTGPKGLCFIICAKHMICSSAHSNKTYSTCGITRKPKTMHSYGSERIIDSRGLACFLIKCTFLQASGHQPCSKPHRNILTTRGQNFLKWIKNQTRDLVFLAYFILPNLYNFLNRYGYNRNRRGKERGNIFKGKCWKPRNLNSWQLRVGPGFPQGFRHILLFIISVTCHKFWILQLQLTCDSIYNFLRNTSTQAISVSPFYILLCSGSQIVGPWPTHFLVVCKIDRIDWTTCYLGGPATLLPKSPI